MRAHENWQTGGSYEHMLVTIKLQGNRRFWNRAWWVHNVRTMLMSVIPSKAQGADNF